MYKKIKIGSLIGLLSLISFLTFGCNKIESNANYSNQGQLKITRSNFNGLSKSQYLELASLNFKSGQNPIIQVNHGKSTLDTNAWQRRHIYYQNLDSLNRTSSSTTAFLDKNNLAKSQYRTRQYIKPTGWHNNRPNQEVYNRGHLIAYSLSAGINKMGKYSTNNQTGDQNNPKNLFTQTAVANQELQTIYESKVREALYRGCKVIYQATPIFRGKELMARGINLQAISTDRTLDFNVYVFNVQPSFIFDYRTGKATKDQTMKVDFQQNQKYSKYKSKISDTLKQSLHITNSQVTGILGNGKFRNKNERPWPRTAVTLDDLMGE